MIGAVAWTRVSFEDVPLTGVPENVFQVCAAILASGIWYSRDGAPWFEDVLLGPQHIQDFKGAKSAALRRRIVTRWEGSVRMIEGAPMTAPDIAEQYRSDGRFRAFCRALPKFEGIYAKLMRDASERARTVCAEQYGRQLILPVHGNLEIKTQLANEYEG